MVGTKICPSEIDRGRGLGLVGNGAHGNVGQGRNAGGFAIATSRLASSVPAAEPRRARYGKSISGAEAEDLGPLEAPGRHWVC